MSRVSVKKGIIIVFVVYFQTLETELICSTAYVELFIRRITEARLLSVFLKFIFIDSADTGKPIIDILVDRLCLQTQVWF